MPAVTSQLPLSQYSAPRRRLRRRRRRLPPQRPTPRHRCCRLAAKPLARGRSPAPPLGPLGAALSSRSPVLRSTNPRCGRRSAATAVGGVGGKACCAGGCPLAAPRLGAGRPPPPGLVGRFIGGLPPAASSPGGGGPAPGGFPPSPRSPGPQFNAADSAAVTLLHPQILRSVGRPAYRPPLRSGYTVPKRHSRQRLGFSLDKHNSLTDQSSKRAGCQDAHPS